METTLKLSGRFYGPLSGSRFAIPRGNDLLAP